jgi:hypothetical protein
LTLIHREVHPPTGGGGDRHQEVCNVSAGATHYVYVDETGDRGWGGVSSPIFGLRAVVVARDRDAELRDALGRINTNMRRRRNNPLHWSTNVNDHPSRKMVARELVTLPITIINVVVCKKSLMGSGTALSRPDTDPTEVSE